MSETAAAQTDATTPRLDGRVAIVTGASRGIGLGIAQAIVDAGGAVCLTARREEELTAAVAEIGANAISVVGAADDPEHRAEAIAAAAREFGRPVDMVVNNAAVNPKVGPLVEEDDFGAFRKTLEVNVIAALGWVQAAWRAGMKDTGGSVVNVASVGGLHGQPNLGMYNISKAALIHLTSQLALEMAPKVRVNAIAPAVVRTRFAEPLFEGREESVTRLYPLGRIGEVDDTAAAVRYLLSDAAGWVTGQTLTLDGGMTLWQGPMS